MANPRRPYTQAEQVSLTTQVGGFCPLCDAELFYKKRSGTYKAYELAHIYPLNPTPEEHKELAGVRHLSVDVNHPDNIIALCTPCHTKFDKPRTLEEYEKLVSIKQRALDKVAHRALNSEYPLEAQIRSIVSRLHTVAIGENDTTDLDFDPKRMDDKFLPTMPIPTRRKIKHAVTDYYSHIRRLFAEVEHQDPMSSQLIFAQVRTFYFKQKSLNLPQSAIFANVVEWIRTTADAQTLEAAEIVASFFVQNCEVFE
jgi:hypothetical protein